MVYLNGKYVRDLYLNKVISKKFFPIPNSKVEMGVVLVSKLNAKTNMVGVNFAERHIAYRKERNDGGSWVDFTSQVPRGVNADCLNNIAEMLKTTYSEKECETLFNTWKNKNNIKYEQDPDKRKQILIANGYTFEKPEVLNQN